MSGFESRGICGRWCNGNTDVFGTSIVSPILTRPVAVRITVITSGSDPEDLVSITRPPVTQSVFGSIAELV